jgi:hypothetical protein
LSVEEVVDAYDLEIGAILSMVAMSTDSLPSPIAMMDQQAYGALVNENMGTDEAHCL